MSIMAWIIVGIIAGWMAKGVIPGEGAKGVLGDLVTGIVGAIAGGWIFAYFGHPGATGLNIGFIVVRLCGRRGRAGGDAAAHRDKEGQSPCSANFRIADDSPTITPNL